MGGGGSKDFDYRQQLLQDYEAQGAFAEGTKESDNHTPCLRDPNAIKGFLGFLPGEDEKSEVDNCIKGLQRSVRLYGERQMLGWRPFVDGVGGRGQSRGDYVFQSYADTWAEMQSAGKGIYELLKSEEANVGIYGGNRPEWLVSAFGLYTQRYRSVALYDTLGQEAVEYILGHAELQAIFCQKKNLPNLFKSVENAGDLPLKYIIVWDYNEKYNNKHEAISEEDSEQAKALDIELVSFTQLIETGAGSSRECDEPGPDDIAYIMYTSGTTGLPKGVLLSHGNFAVTIASCFRWMKPILGDDEWKKTTPGGTDKQPDCNGTIHGQVMKEHPSWTWNMGRVRHVSFLPLAHSFEALMHQVTIIMGGVIAYQQGNIKLLTADWLAIRPTIIAGVPRVYQKIYDKVMAGVVEAGCMKRWIFNMAISSGNAKIRQGNRSSFFEKKVWSQVRAKVGWDNIRLVISGAAPLPPYLGEFLKVMSNTDVVQGYGMTETTALGSKMNVGDVTVGHCGAPFDNIEIRLESVAEMNYLVTDTVEVNGQTLPAPRGEVHMRGPSIFKGYYKAPDKTAETITKDGWLLTGDIGRINPNGTLSIIDRKKNIFKTSFGEYIASEKIEGFYSKASSVGQCWVYGNSYKSKILAVVVPDGIWAKSQLEEWGQWPEESGSPNDTPGTAEFARKFTDIASKNIGRLQEATLKLMRELEAPLKKIERVVDIILEVEIDDMLQGFNVAKNTLTPTFKLRRKQLLDSYREKIRQCYTANGEAPKDAEDW